MPRPSGPLPFQRPFFRKYPKILPYRSTLEIEAKLTIEQHILGDEEVSFRLRALFAGSQHFLVLEEQVKLYVTGD
ncbi:MAG: hypothetical protein ACYSU4_03070 [Planctomycetota bacterium]|jgi:hypothetical protein